MSTLLSFVIPCYRSEKTIEMVINEILSVVSQRKEFDYEIICVNDCSPDNVWSVLKKLAQNNQKIKIINFASNAGKDAAILAAFALSKGEYIISLDDDGQCPTNELWRLLDPVIKDECDVAAARYIEKKQKKWKNIGSDINLLMSRMLLDQPKDVRMENFFAFKRFVVDEVVKYHNSYAYLDGLVLRVTKNIKPVEMEERSRADDNTTGYTLKKSIKLFLNGMTSFSVKPLRVSTIVGFSFAVLGMIIAVIAAVRKIMGIIDVDGYTSLMIVQLIVGGLVLMSLGMIGEYIGRTYISINSPPQYVIREKQNFE